MTQCCLIIARDGTLHAFSAAILSNSPENKSQTRKQEPNKKKKGSRAMARIDFGYVPQGNPCAQCGKPIGAPEWIESGPRCTWYLWHCRACDYQFEAMAIFADQESDTKALAA
jgi:formamidopyrimidine-DNA glycosylase